jgi:hypothetical protein
MSINPRRDGRLLDHWRRSGMTKHHAQPVQVVNRFAKGCWTDVLYFALSWTLCRVVTVPTRSIVVLASDCAVTHGTGSELNLSGTVRRRHGVITKQTKKITSALQREQEPSWRLLCCRQAAYHPDTSASW